MPAEAASYENLKTVFVSYEAASAGTNDHTFVLDLPSTTVTTIAFMGDEGIANYFDYATVYSVTFHFTEGFVGGDTSK